MSDQNLRRLTRAVKNPDYDGRRKYSYEKIKEFPAGTTFIANDRWEDAKGYPHPASVNGVNKKFWIVGAVAQILIACSEPITPNTWDEYRMAEGDTDNDAWINREVLNKMWAEGHPVIRDAIKRAFKDAMKEGDA